VVRGRKGEKVLSKRETYESGLGEFRVGSFACCDRFGRVTESPWFVVLSINGRWVYTDDYDQQSSNCVQAGQVAPAI
jgi:hypothetical protein